MLKLAATTSSFCCRCCCFLLYHPAFESFAFSDKVACSSVCIGGPRQGGVGQPTSSRSLMGHLPRLSPGCVCTRGHLSWFFLVSAVCVSLFFLVTVLGHCHHQDPVVGQGDSAFFCRTQICSDQPASVCHTHTHGVSQDGVTGSCHSPLCGRETTSGNVPVKKNALTPHLHSGNRTQSF